VLAVVNLRVRTHENVRKLQTAALCLSKSSSCWVVNTGPHTAAPTSTVSS
jgi:hypothetical protein